MRQVTPLGQNAKHLIMIKKITRHVHVHSMFIRLFIYLFIFICLFIFIYLFYFILPQANDITKLMNKKEKT